MPVPAASSRGGPRCPPAWVKMSGVHHQPDGPAFDVVLILHVGCVVVGLATLVASAPRRRPPPHPAPDRRALPRGGRAVLPSRGELGRPHRLRHPRLRLLLLALEPRGLLARRRVGHGWARHLGRAWSCWPRACCGRRSAGSRSRWSAVGEAACRRTESVQRDAGHELSAATVALVLLVAGLRPHGGAAVTAATGCRLTPVASSTRRAGLLAAPGPDQRGKRAVEQGGPVHPLGAPPGVVQALARLAQQFGQFAQSGPAARGQPGAQPGRQRGAGPPGGDGDGHRAVAVHRRQDERAVRHVVGAVHPHPGRLGIGVDRAVDGRDRRWR